MRSRDRPDLGEPGERRVRRDVAARQRRCERQADEPLQTSHSAWHLTSKSGPDAAPRAARGKPRIRHGPVQEPIPYTRSGSTEPDGSAAAESIHKDCFDAPEAGFFGKILKVPPDRDDQPSAQIPQPPVALPRSSRLLAIAAARAVRGDGAEPAADERVQRQPGGPTARRRRRATSRHRTAGAAGGRRTRRRRPSGSCAARARRPRPGGVDLCPGPATGPRRRPRARGHRPLRAVGAGGGAAVPASSRSLSADTETFELLEVSRRAVLLDLPPHREEPAHAPTVDVRRVREPAGRTGAPGAADGPYLGGIQRMLGWCGTGFDSRRRPPAISTACRCGSWRGVAPETSLAVVLPHAEGRVRRPAGIGPADLPDGDAVERAASRSAAANCFPSASSGWPIPGPRPVAATALEPVAVIELYDVRIGEPVDATAFVYQPATRGADRRHRDARQARSA